MEKVQFAKNTVIFNKGDKADVMYKILTGKVKIMSHYGTDNPVELATKGADEYFGEMGIIDASERSATAVADSDVDLLAIDADSFESFVADNTTDAIEIMENLSKSLRNTTKDYLDAQKAVDKLAAMKDGAPKHGESIFAKIKHLFTDKPEDNTIGNPSNKYTAGQVVFQKGAKADNMFKILAGTVTFYANYGKPNQTQIAEITKGAIFGEMGVIEGEKRSATAIAKTDVELLPIANSNFTKYIEQHPEDAIKILRNISQSVRRTTLCYLDMLKTISELVKANQKIADEELWNQLVAYSNVYDTFTLSEFGFNGINYGMYTNGIFY